MLLTRGMAKEWLGRPLRMKTTGRLSWEIIPDYQSIMRDLLVPPEPGSLWVIEEASPEGFIEIKLRHKEDVEFLDTPWEDTAALEAEIRRLLEEER